MTLQGTPNQSLGDLVVAKIPGLPASSQDLKKLLPSLAKDGEAVAKLRKTAANLPTEHSLLLQDSRSLRDVADGSVHLVVTSPPYWTLKQYKEGCGQLGHIEDFEEFASELDRVWQECYRVLIPGGRAVIVVGDVCLSRRGHGKHQVIPLHATVQEHCRLIGFDNLAPIIWYKISNVSLEVNGRSGYLGKPYEPNAIIKNDIEYILMQRKPGGYRHPSPAMRLMSLISREEHHRWFRQIWTLPGAPTRSHPAPYPLELAERLIRMFSFVSDMVLDPFTGTGTTNVAAALSGRNSVGYDIDPDYLAHAASRLERETRKNGRAATIRVNGSSVKGKHGIPG